MIQFTSFRELIEGLLRQSHPLLSGTNSGIAFFVRQHYLDFLGRELEANEPWSNILRNCSNQFNTDPNNSAAGCDRINASGEFFGSPEFKTRESM